jgi:hypothetical protein
MIASQQQQQRRNEREVFALTYSLALFVFSQIASHKNYVSLVDLHKQAKDGRAAADAKAPQTKAPETKAAGATAAAAAAAAPAPAAAAAPAAAVTIVKPDSKPDLDRKQSHGKSRGFELKLSAPKKQAAGAKKADAAAPTPAPVTPTAVKQPAPASPAAAAATAPPPLPASKPAPPPAVATAEEEGPGPWPKVLTLDYVTAMMDWFKGNQVTHTSTLLVADASDSCAFVGRLVGSVWRQILELDAVEAMLAQALPMMKAEPNIRRISVATKVTVIGDIHGRLRGAALGWWLPMR